MLKKSDEQQRKPHMGMKVQRLREVIGMKQAVFARIIGKSQQSISSWEQRETIPDEILERLAVGLDVTADFIRHFDEKQKIPHILKNTLSAYVTSSYHPIDKVVELFEQLLQAEKEKMEVLTNAHHILLDLAEQLHALRKGQSDEGEGRSCS